MLIIFSQDDVLPTTKFVFTAAIFIMLFITITNLMPTAGTSYWAKAFAQEHSRAIEAFAACHENEPNYTYMFDGEASRIAFQYGALTGNKVAIIPSNFKRLDKESRNAFFQTIAPYRLFRSLKVDNCDTSDSLSWREGGSE